MQFTSPVIVRLKGNPALGEGIMVGGETYLDIAKDESGEIQRGADGGPIMVKKRDCFVFWPADPSEIFVHQLSELEPVEVVACRTLEEMKQEVKDEVIDEVLEILEAEDNEAQGEPEPNHEPEPEADEE